MENSKTRNSILVRGNAPWKIAFSNINDLVPIALKSHITFTLSLQAIILIWMKSKYWTENLTVLKGESKRPSTRKSTSLRSTRIGATTNFQESSLFVGQVSKGHDLKYTYSCWWKTKDRLKIPRYGVYFVLLLKVLNFKSSKRWVGMLYNSKATDDPCYFFITLWLSIKCKMYWQSWIHYAWRYFEHVNLLSECVQKRLSTSSSSFICDVSSKLSTKITQGYFHTCSNITEASWKLFIFLNGTSLIFDKQKHVYRIVDKIYASQDNEE